MRMRFGVLGPIEVRVAGEQVRVDSEKQRRLLAALVARAGTVVSTDRLISVLWGDEPPPSALASLRTYVYRLRGILDDGVMATRAPGYVLQVTPGQVDAGRFEELVAASRHEQEDPRRRLVLLEEALSLWRGRAYAEFADAEFARGEALRLEELRRVATEDRVDAKLALGEHAEVVGDLEALVDQHPLRERARGQLMLALYRCGRQADALAACREYRTLLDEELGLAVSGSLAELERDILRHSPALAGVPPGPRDRTGARGARRLPAEPGSLVGRGDDVARVRAALGGARLVTITGPGGVGKTRLALRVAHELAEARADGVGWCELAPVSDGAQVADAVATTLGVLGTEGGDATAAVVEVLRTRDTLLVLDNTEHVLDAVSSLVGEVVRTCPATTVLATSRAPLGAPEEQVHRLGPLAVPAADDDQRGGPALDLIVERARAARPDLVVSGDELGQLAEICRRLDGLPLALELAASRLRSMNPDDLEARLDRRLDVVTDTRHPRERHRGLREVVDWSYRLLSRTEQQLFCRLSVFAGSFTLRAAERVGTGRGVAEDEVLDLLTSLVDHSLVVALPTGGHSRYALLETLRSHAREQLREVGDEAPTRRRHAAFHVELAETADRQVRGRDEAAGVARMDRELDNLRAAHRWTIEHRDTDLALRLAAATFRYALWRLRAEVFGWAEAAARLPGAAAHPLLPTVAGMAGWGAGLRGELDDADDWAARGLAALDDPRDPRALAPLEVQMHTALWQGDLRACRDHAGRAAALTRDPYELVPAYVPGLALTYDGRPAEALALLDDVQEAADRHGSPTMRALVHYARGEALLETEPRAAGPELERAAELAAAVDNRVVLGVADVSLISLLARHDQPHRALQSFPAVIARLQQAGDWTHLWTGLRSLIRLLVRLERHGDAAVLFGAMSGSTTAPPAYGDDAERLAEVRRTLEQRLGEHELASARSRGRAMTDHDAATFAGAAVERCLGG